MNRKLTNRDGFTLIEIVIAVAIVAIFAAALSPMVFRHLEDAKLTKAQNEAETVATAVLTYYKDTGAWPYTNADGPSGNGIARMVSHPVIATGAGAGAGTGAAKWGTEGTVKPLGDYLYFNNPDDDSSATGTGADQAAADWPVTGQTSRSARSRMRPAVVCCRLASESKRSSERSRWRFTSCTLRSTLP